MPYLKKFGVNPVTGKKMTSKDLIHIKFDKDDEGLFTFELFIVLNYLCFVRSLLNSFFCRTVPLPSSVQNLHRQQSHRHDQAYWKCFLLRSYQCESLTLLLTFYSNFLGTKLEEEPFERSAHR